jgi:hypothetical protein
MRCEDVHVGIVKLILWPTELYEPDVDIEGISVAPSIFFQLSSSLENEADVPFIAPDVVV